MRTDNNAASYGFTLAGRAPKGCRSQDRVAAPQRKLDCAVPPRRDATGPRGVARWTPPGLGTRNWNCALRQWSFVEPLLG
jgi:hypothetical protein